MSRVGKYPVIIPEGVSASVNGNVVNVKGKLGELSFAYDDSHVNVEINDGKIVVTPHSQSRTARTLWGTTRAQINSLVKGVSAGYSKSIERRWLQSPYGRQESGSDAGLFARCTV